MALHAIAPAAAASAAGSAADADASGDTADAGADDDTAAPSAVSSSTFDELGDAVRENTSAVAATVSRNLTAASAAVERLAPAALVRQVGAVTVEAVGLPERPSPVGIGGRGVGGLLRGLPDLHLWLLFGYSRYDATDPLDSERRAAIFETVRGSPGIHVSGLARETAIPRSTVRHHLRVLDDERLVRLVKRRGKQRVYPAGHDDVELDAALADEATAEVLDAVGRLEPASVSELAAALDRSPSTVSYHLDSLADAGLLVRARTGNAVAASLSPAVRDALVGESLAD